MVNKMAILFDTGFLFALYNKEDLDNEIVKDLILCPLNCALKHEMFDG